MRLNEETGADIMKRERPHSAPGSRSSCRQKKVL